MKKACVFVDGENFRYSLCDLFGNGKYSFSRKVNLSNSGNGFLVKTATMVRGTAEGALNLMAATRSSMRTGAIEGITGLRQTWIFQRR